MQSFGYQLVMALVILGDTLFHTFYETLRNKALLFFKRSQTFIFNINSYLHSLHIIYFVRTFIPLNYRG